MLCGFRTFTLCELMCKLLTVRSRWRYSKTPLPITEGVYSQSSAARARKREMGSDTVRWPAGERLDAKESTNCIATSYAGASRLHRTM